MTASVNRTGSLSLGAPTRLALALFASVLTIACSVPEFVVTPDSTELGEVLRVETLVGWEATQEALQGVNRELQHLVAAQEASSDQLARTRRRQLEERSRLLASILRDQTLSETLASHGTCVAHADAQLTTHFTTSYVWAAVADIGGYTAADRTTSITTSIYSEIGPGEGRSGFYDGATNANSSGCTTSVYVLVRIGHRLGLVGRPNSPYYAYGETAHILPLVGATTWTQDTAVEWVPQSLPYGRPDPWPEIP